MIPNRRIWQGGNVRRAFSLVVMVAAFCMVAAFSPAFGAPSSSSHESAGSESEDLTEAQAWFTDQRLAPNGVVNPDAFAAIPGQAATLPVTGGAWTERTDPAGDGVDFSDSPQYIDPTSNFSNSGALTTGTVPH